MKDLIALLKAGRGLEIWRDGRQFVVQVYSPEHAQNYYNRSLRAALRAAAQDELPKQGLAPVSP